MIVFLTLLGMLAAAAAVEIRLYCKIRLLSSKSCVSIIERIHYVDLSELCSLTKHPSKTPQQEEALQLVRLGGIRGLERLSENAGAMMDLARYLIIMNPEAKDLAYTVRRDAGKVQSLVKALTRQHRYPKLIRPVAGSIEQLAKIYVTTTVNTLTLSASLLDGILPLIQQVETTHARMLRSDLYVSERWNARVTC